MALGVVGGYVMDVPTPEAWTVTALDGSGLTFYPTEVYGFDMEAESRNVEHETIDGGLAVALGGDALRTGTIRFLFGDDSAASAARVILGRPCAFAIALPARPVFALSFVRRGRLSAAVHDDVRDVWEFECEYREVSA